MKVEFSSLTEAINYHRICPICQQKMLLNCQQSQSLVPSKYTLLENMISPHQNPSLTPPKCVIFDLMIANNLRIDLDTNQASLVARDDGLYSERKNIYPAMVWHGLIMNCSKCRKFSYAIQMLTDVSIPKLLNIRLNSETIAWEDRRKTLHQVRNCYPTETTEYSVFPLRSISQEKHIDLPLVPLNLSNPEETVSRVRTFVVFL